jgi:hypothetical protein
MEPDPQAKEAALRYRDLTATGLLKVIHSHTIEVASTPSTQRRTPLLHLSAAYAKAIRRRLCLCGCGRTA